MLFTSPLYLLFLVIVVVLFWQLPQKFRIPLLLASSYMFYMAWSPPFGLIYGPVIFLDSLYFYWLSCLMTRYPQWKKQILIVGVTTELGLLAFFKYSNFLLTTFENVFRFFHLPANHIEVHIFLPLAISFTNFILISYLVDVYRGKEKPDTCVRFCTYVAFFPHLIAGPIVRASELLHQFDKPRRFQMARLFHGLHLFVLGFALKSFIADVLAPYVDLIYGKPSLQGFDTAWIATYSFALQIFCDFWGYTLMAQGSAFLLGYRLPENFRSPYFAVNITDFWRRWHISLSRWLRDYLYIPLGGSKVNRFVTSRNLFITMGLGGLWHGASWNFVIWGIIHGLYLSIHKLASHWSLNRFIPTLVAWFVTFHAVCIAWVFFRAQGFTQAVQLLSVMFDPATLKGTAVRTQNLVDGSIALFIVCGFLLGHYLAIQLKDPIAKRKLQFDLVRGLAYACVIYLLVTMKTAPQQFIYFQF